MNFGDFSRFEFLTGLVFFSVFTLLFSRFLAFGSVELESLNDWFHGQILHRGLELRRVDFFCFASLSSSSSSFCFYPNKFLDLIFVRSFPIFPLKLWSSSCFNLLDSVFIQISFQILFLFIDFLTFVFSSGHPPASISIAGT
ncbi:hypothetical protein NE237_014736 [Protea cynaroides]|uniref:Uncharacterized protein n=1 Tax=Protea cynaroides TaxID=273540 RepID=A0A9Q0QQ95_9MAGN|nr:hypothetical protein NE237_014736 [Protea cynaroides]